MSGVKILKKLYMYCQHHDNQDGQRYSEMFHGHISVKIFIRELRNLGFEMTELKIDTVRFKKSSLTAFSRGKSKSSFRTV